LNKRQCHAEQIVVAVLSVDLVDAFEAADGVVAAAGSGNSGC
jgi:hypothetical protein